MLNEVNIENIKEVWDLFGNGHTKGLFQLESNLGKSWAKKLQPMNLEQLSALVTILRPGSLRAIIDDKSITQHYVDRRHGKEAITYIDESCKDILSPTLGLMLYQEQTMEIAKKIAGFSGVDADRLRKSIGKKKADLMESLRHKFINGCVETGIVTKQKAEEIFEIIEKSARYQFNACLDPNTFVETDRGEIKTLDELSVGEKILCPTENGDKFVEVLNFMESGDKELYEVELEDGFSIICSLDHEFMCEDSIKRSLSEILENNHKIMCIE
jgi:DNA polymerase-3 subunit alpha